MMSSSSSATTPTTNAESQPKDNAAVDAPVEEQDEDEEEDMVDSVATDDVPEPEWNSSDEEYEYCDYDLRDQAEDDVQVAVDQKKLPAGLKTTGLDDEEHPQKMVVSASVSSSSTSPSNHATTPKTTTSLSSSDICPTCHGELHHPVQDCVKLQAWLQKRRSLPTIPPRSLLSCLKWMMHRYMIEQAPQYVDLHFVGAVPTHHEQAGTYHHNHTHNHNNELWRDLVAEAQGDEHDEHNNPPESLLRPAPLAHLVYVCCTAETGWDLNRMVRDYEHVFLQHLLLQRHVDHRTNIIPRRAPRRRTPNPQNQVHHQVHPNTRNTRRTIPRRNPLRDTTARRTRGGGRRNPNHPETTSDLRAPATTAAEGPANENLLRSYNETNERIMQAMRDDDEQWEDDDDDQVANENNEEMDDEYDHDNDDDYVVEDYFDNDEEPILNGNLAQHRQGVAIEALLQELYPAQAGEDGVVVGLDTTHIPDRYIPWCDRLAHDIMNSFLDWPVETLAENVAKLALWSAPRSITRVRRRNPAPHVHPFYDQIEYVKGDFETLPEYLRDRLTRAVDQVLLIRRRPDDAGVTTASIVALFDTNIAQFEAQRQQEEDEARKDDNDSKSSDQKTKQDDPKPSSAKRSRATTRSAAAATVNNPTKNETATTTARLKDPPPSRKRYGAPLAKAQAASTLTTTAAVAAVAAAAAVASKKTPPPQAPPPPDTDTRASTQKPAPAVDKHKENKTKLELAPKRKQQPACIICLDDDLGQDEIFTLRCHHGVCKDCWKGYIRVGLDSGTGGHAIVQTCPAADCTVPLTLNEVSILAPELIEKYEQRMLESFVQAHGQYVAWCPGPDCTQAAIVPPADLFEDDTLDFLCGKCSTSFCFRCKAAPHPGEPCQAPDPIEREPEQAPAAAARPAAAAAVAVPNEEVAPENRVAAALVAHQPEAAPLLTTKPIKKCPKCKVDIEKTGGCNRMRCRCGHAFCWLCLAENRFYDHFCGLAAQQRRQGNGPRPNRQRIPPPVIDHNYLIEALRHEGPLDRETTELVDQLDALPNYAHYYNRYHAHGVGQRFAESQCPCLEGRIMDYTHMVGFVNSGAEVDFIRAANQTIYASRRVLKYSYCSSFFLQQNSNPATATDDDDEAFKKASHLAIQLERLETFTEELSDISENALSRESRKRVLELIAVVEKTMSVMADMDL